MSRETFRIFHTLVLLVLVSIAAPGARAASLYDTKCGSLSGTTVTDTATTVLNVAVDRRTATPPTDDIRRREQVRISSGLATALGLGATDAATTGEAAQVRVELETTDPNTGLIHTASFSIAEIDALDTGRRLSVWLPDDLDGSGNFGDHDNGFFKLFGIQQPNTVFSGSPEATVYRMAPGTTTVVTNGSVTEYVHFDEPNTGSKYFRECVELRGDDSLAVLSPHGGGIETKISGELDTFLSELESFGREPSVWEGYGQWGSGETFDRWHITSTQLSEGSFPGLEDLVSGGTYQYVLSLHGYSDNEVGVVLGGQASRQAKCYLVDTLEQVLDSRGTLDGEITYRIFGPDGDPVDVVRDSDGPGDNPQPLNDVDDLDGDSDHNIVNRMAPNPLGIRGFGGIQLELSDDLRKDTTLFHEFIRALASAVDSLITQNPQSDTCNQYEPTELSFQNPSLIVDGSPRSVSVSARNLSIQCSNGSHNQSTAIGCWN